MFKSRDVCQPQISAGQNPAITGSGIDVASDGGDCVEFGVSTDEWTERGIAGARTLPATRFAQLLEQVIARMDAQRTTEEGIVPVPWQSVQNRFGVVWLADGSTLEAVAKKLDSLQQHASELGGKMMMIVEVFSHRPVAAWYTSDAYAHDQQWNDALIERLPKGGLLIFDLGCFNFVWFDAFTLAQKYFLTRWRQKTAGKVIRVLSQEPRYRDELLELGR